MIMPMTTSLVAKHVPLQKRTGTLGILMATMSLSYLIGTPIISMISDYGGWRFPFLVYALPFPVLGILLVIKGLPLEPESEQLLNKGGLLDGYRGIMSNRSAIACLLGGAFSSAAFTGITLYAASFYREVFILSRSSATYIIVGASLSYTIGAIVSGKFVNRYGRKTITCSTALIAGVLTLSFTVISNLWASLIVLIFGCLFSGMRATAIMSLTLEQVPEFRGSMMSVSAASEYLGAALGSFLGGLAILYFSYYAIGPLLGLVGIIAPIIIYLYGVDII